MYLKKKENTQSESLNAVGWLAGSVRDAMALFIEALHLCKYVRVRIQRKKYGRNFLFLSSCFFSTIECSLAYRQEYIGCIVCVISLIRLFVYDMFSLSKSRTFASSKFKTWSRRRMILLCTSFRVFLFKFYMHKNANEQNMSTVLGFVPNQLLKVCLCACASEWVSASATTSQQPEQDED